MMPDWFFASITAVVIALTGWAVVQAGLDTSGLKPMPCRVDEVYVWTTYPDDATCKLAIDHAQHQGD